jgi:cytochrome c-type biogenesis protein
MQQSALPLQILLAFGGGVISFISPCVLPLVPGYLAMMSGYSAAQLEAGDVSLRRMARVAVEFVIGFTLVFAALGATATGLGQFLVDNQSVMTRVAGGLIIAFGILMVVLAAGGGDRLGFLSREHRVDVRPSRLGEAAPLVMGMAFAFAWTPCLGPILSVVLATAATQGTLLAGVTLLIAYSLGLGIPFILAALGWLKVIGRMRKWLRPVSIGAGVVMVVFGLVMVTGNIGTIAGYVTDLVTTVPWLQPLAQI